MSDVYVALHIATTCDSNEGIVPRDSMEIIELSYSLIDASSLTVLLSDDIFIKPVNTPVTAACSSVTGITWDDVKDCGSFKDAISKFDKVIQDNILSSNKDFSFVSMDISKLRVQLPREARDKSVVLPPYLQHPRLFDLQNEYCKWQATHPEALSYTSSSLTNIITALEVDINKSEIPQLHNDSQTPPPSATALTSSNSFNHDSTPVPETKEDDATVTKKQSLNQIYSKILIQLIKKSLPVEEHSSVLTKPYDLSHDVKLFLTERSKILYLSNLPFDTTQAELESWFTQFGARPIAFWTLKHLESNNQNSSPIQTKAKKGISGFAVFATHEEATESLSMNGRALNNRPIEIQPSSTRVLNKASDILTPFPPSKNRPRPGDWTCPSCGFSNFQRRTACFRCSFPASSAVAFQEQTHTNGNINNRRNHNGSHNNMGLTNNSNNNNPANGNDKLNGNNMYSNNQYYNDHNNHNHNNHMNNRPYNSNGNSVPFRAGDWKCTNEACQYHNFAKNLVCLKCGLNKPINLQNSNQVNNKSNQIHSVSSTAAAIAAATASGQPLNLSNSYMGLHNQNGQNQMQSQGSNNYKQPVSYYNNNLSRTSSNTTPGPTSMSNNIQNNSIQGSIPNSMQTSSHMLAQQYLMMQPVDSQSPQFGPTSQSVSSNVGSQPQSISPVGASHSSGPATSTIQSDNSANSSTNSPGLYQAFGYSPYRNGQLDSLNFNSISNQFGSLNLNKN